MNLNLDDKFVVRAKVNLSYTGTEKQCNAEGKVLLQSPSSPGPRAFNPAVSNRLSFSFPQSVLVFSIPP